MAEVMRREKEGATCLQTRQNGQQGRSGRGPRVVGGRDPPRGNFGHSGASGRVAVINGRLREAVLGQRM